MTSSEEGEEGGMTRSEEGEEVGMICSYCQMSTGMTPLPWVSPPNTSHGLSLLILYLAHLPFSQPETPFPGVVLSTVGAIIPCPCHPEKGPRASLKWLWLE